MKILGFDIGIASIGWAFVENGELKKCGVRIFTKAENPENGKSLALPRREARSVRRRLARRKSRLEALKRLLAKEWACAMRTISPLKACCLGRLRAKISLIPISCVMRG